MSGICPRESRFVNKITKRNKMPRQLTEGWKFIDWKTIEYRIFKLQELIFRSAKDKNIRKVRKLQNTLLSLLDAKLLAVRKVTRAI